MRLSGTDKKKAGLSGGLSVMERRGYFAWGGQGISCWRLQTGAEGEERDRDLLC